MVEKAATEMIKQLSGWESRHCYKSIEYCDGMGNHCEEQ